MHPNPFVSTARTIKEGRLRLGMNAREFAEAVGVSRAAVQHWERAQGTAPSRAHQQRVAQVLGISVAELLTGLPASIRRNLAPVITDPHRHVQVDAEELIRHAVARVPVLSEVKGQTFAYRMHGDSMVGDGRDSFPDDAVVVVEPELVARPGDFVVAQVDSDGLTLRQLVQEAGHRFLKPLNARYPVTPLHEAHILGVVRELSRVYR